MRFRSEDTEDNSSVDAKTLSGLRSCFVESALGGTGRRSLLWRRKSPDVLKKSQYFSHLTVHSISLFTQSHLLRDHRTFYKCVYMKYFCAMGGLEIKVENL